MFSANVRIHSQSVYFCFVYIILDATSERSMILPRVINLMYKSQYRYSWRYHIFALYLHFIYENYSKYILSSITHLSWK